jgi:hypothetical protein
LDLGWFIAELQEFELARGVHQVSIIAQGPVCVSYAVPPDVFPGGGFVVRELGCEHGPLGLHPTLHMQVGHAAIFVRLLCRVSTDLKELAKDELVEHFLDVTEDGRACRRAWGLHFEGVKHFRRKGAFGECASCVHRASKASARSDIGGKLLDGAFLLTVKRDTNL